MILLVSGCSCIFDQGFKTHHVEVYFAPRLLTAALNWKKKLETCLNYLFRTYILPYFGAGICLLTAKEDFLKKKLKGIVNFTQATPCNTELRGGLALVWFLNLRLCVTLLDSFLQ